MKYNFITLRDFLNYDTHTSNFLSYQERLIIHHYIHKLISAEPKERKALEENIKECFSFSLNEKLTYVKRLMRTNKWIATQGAYREDKQTGKITFDTIK